MVNFPIHPRVHLAEQADIGLRLGDEFFLERVRLDYPTGHEILFS